MGYMHYIINLNWLLVVDLIIVPLDRSPKPVIITLYGKDFA